MSRKLENLQNDLQHINSKKATLKSQHDALVAKRNRLNDQIKKIETKVTKLSHRAKEIGSRVGGMK